MNKLSHSELLDAMARYGYELERPVRGLKTEEVLSSLAREKDARVLEGFPVVYRNMLSSSGRERAAGTEWRFFEELSKDDRAKLVSLLVVSRFLFRLYGEDAAKVRETERVLSKLAGNWRQRLKPMESDLSGPGNVRLNDKFSLSAERLRERYRNYVVNRSDKDALPPEMALDMELELLFSEFFTPKQKQLLKKRLKGEVMSKTEREYFYRVVKKRLKALSSEKLCRFAGKCMTSV